MKKSIATLLMFIIVFLVGCSSRQDTGDGNSELLFTVTRGSSAQQVAADLAESKLIRNRTIFLLRLRLLGVDKRLEAGTYRFRKSSRMGEIIRILADAKVAKSRVTIPEGATLSAIARAMDKAQVAASGDFLRAAGDPALLKQYHIPGKSFEGYLFPDTYDISLGSGGQAVVELMARRFFERIAKFSPGAADNPEALYKNVVLASIVEREYRVAEEAPLIASVFRNRLKIGMALQSCATVVYVLTEREGKPHPSVVYFKDLEVDDPYNTYRHPGLPPGPIANPGATALAAVFSPAKSEYLYFRITDEVSGTHRFSRTFEEHKEISIPVKGL